LCLVCCVCVVGAGFGDVDGVCGIGVVAVVAGVAGVGGVSVDDVVGCDVGYDVVRGVVGVVDCVVAAAMVSVGIYT